MSKSITYIDYICVGAKTPGSKDYQTPGKLYRVKCESTWSVMGDEDYVTYSFIGDDGVEYLFFPGDKDFLTVEQWREKQLTELGI